MTLQALMVLYIVAPFVLAAVVAVGCGRIAARLGNARAANNWVVVAVVMVVGVACGLLPATFMLDEPAPALPPVIQVDGLLAQCIRDGGVQMAYLDGRWACITPEQAG